MHASEFRWTQVRVGLFVALTGIVLFGAIIYVGLAGTPFAGHVRLRANFADVSGLAVGSPVEMGGVVVGEVASIELPDLETGLMPVKLGVKPEALERLGPSSYAFPSSHALVGQRFVGLTPRKPGEPSLQPGDEIRTRTEATAEALIEQAVQTMEEVRRLAADLRVASDAIARLSTAVVAGEGTLGRLIADATVYERLERTLGHLETATGRLTNGSGSLGVLLQDEKLAADLRSGVGAFAASARAMRDGRGVIGRLVNDEKLGTEVASTLRNLDTVSTRLVEAQGTLGALISDPALLGRMNALVGEMDSLVSDVRRNPTRYIKIQPF